MYSVSIKKRFVLAGFSNIRIHKYSIHRDREIDRSKLAL